MKNELSRLRKLSTTNIESGKLLNGLQPFVELAKTITKSPVCEISINDRFNCWTGTRTDKGLNSMPREERISHPIIGSDGSNIGFIRVYGSKTNQERHPTKLAKEEGTQQEKEQLDQLSNLVSDYVERENKYYALSDKLDNLKASLHRLNHGIRNPITGIIGIADILIHEQQSEISGEQPEINEQQSKFPTKDLTMIKDSAQTIIERIDEVLTKVDAGSGIEPGTTTIRNVIKKLQRLYNPLAQQKDHSLLVKNYAGELTISRQLSCTLKQSIGNLVSNAIKFTPQHGSINIIFSHSVVKGKQMLHVEVDDDGKGMTNEQIVSFNSGKTVEQSIGTAGEESFGIGLNHTRQLVAEQKGSIAAKENQGGGVTFLMTLPLSGVDGAT